MKLTTSPKRVGVYTLEEHPDLKIRARTLTGRERADLKGEVNAVSARASVGYMMRRICEIAVLGWEGIADEDGEVKDIRDESRFDRWSDDLIIDVGQWVWDGFKPSETDAKN